MFRSSRKGVRKEVERIQRNLNKIVLQGAFPLSPPLRVLRGPGWQMSAPIFVAPEMKMFQKNFLNWNSNGFKNGPNLQNNFWSSRSFNPPPRLKRGRCSSPHEEEGVFRTNLQPRMCDIFAYTKKLSETVKFMPSNYSLRFLLDFLSSQELECRFLHGQIKTLYIFGADFGFPQTLIALWRRVLYLSQPVTSYHWLTETLRFPKT